MSTYENLKKAFEAESQANQKYLIFAKKAEEEGYFQIARLFKAAAYAESVHANNHLNVIGEINNTQENLNRSLKDEMAEFKVMYPSFIEAAEEDENEAAVWSFNVANKVEKIHAALYEKAIINLGENMETVYYVCNFCGNTVEKEAPSICPICGAPQKEFTKIS